MSEARDAEGFEVPIRRPDQGDPDLASTLGGALGLSRAELEGWQEPAPDAPTVLSAGSRMAEAVAAAVARPPGQLIELRGPTGIALARVPVRLLLGNLRRAGVEDVIERAIVAWGERHRQHWCSVVGHFTDENPCSLHEV